MTEVSKCPPHSMFRLDTDRWTEPFWNAAREHRLVVARCADCGHHRMPPTPFCPECRSQEINWVELSGAGEIYTYSIVVRPLIPEVADSVPYVTAVITLEGSGGVRLISNVVGAPLDELAIGKRVSVFFEDTPDGVSIPRFRLAS